MLFSFLRTNPDTRYGVVIDIGSGSVGVAVVASDPLVELPTILWSHRERITSGSFFDQKNSIKLINTALLNVFLELGSKGLAALRDHDPQAKLTTMFCSISAPWAYTINSTVAVSEENPFVVSKELLTELLSKAKEKAKTELAETDITELFELETIVEEISNVTANGYVISDPIDKEVRKLSLSQIKGVANKQLIESLKENQEKVVPTATLSMSTFMYSFYKGMDALKPDTSEICLIDITNEATEIGIVRGGVLMHTSHIAFGANSIAREISELTKVSNNEAWGYMRSNGTDLTKTLSAAKAEELQSILASYASKVEALMKQTGDTLAIPKTIFLHTDALTENFFATILKEAATKATSSQHTVHFVTSKFFSTDSPNDTAILLSAYVFHKNLISARLE
ncbi:hypothetical protein H6783_02915 [Candidatus Nomurabacteria bacterium]|nr:hypothetical protein [Candidatus Nomurabacteria bacterium]